VTQQPQTLNQTKRNKPTNKTNKTNKTKQNKQNKQTQNTNPKTRTTQNTNPNNPKPKQKKAISVMGMPGVAMLVEFDPVRGADVVLPDGATFVIANSLAVSKKAETAAKR
jgi:hypothetical protein